MYYNSLFEEIISTYLLIFVSILKSPPYFVCSATFEFNLIPIWSKLIYVSEMSEDLGWAAVLCRSVTPSDWPTDISNLYFGIFLIENATKPISSMEYEIMFN